MQRDRMEDEFDARQVIESYQSGPIKRLTVSFTAAVERVTIRFEDPTLDELRFDRAGGGNDTIGLKGLLIGF